MGSKTESFNHREGCFFANGWWSLKATFGQKLPFEKRRLPITDINSLATGIDEHSY